MLKCQCCGKNVSKRTIQQDILVSGKSVELQFPNRDVHCTLEIHTAAYGDLGLYEEDLICRKCLDKIPDFIPIQLAPKDNPTLELMHNGYTEQCPLCRDTLTEDNTTESDLGENSFTTHITGPKGSVGVSRQLREEIEEILSNTDYKVCKRGQKTIDMYVMGEKRSIEVKV